MERWRRARVKHCRGEKAQGKQRRKNGPESALEPPTVVCLPLQKREVLNFVNTTTLHGRCSCKTPDSGRHSHRARYNFSRVAWLRTCRSDSQPRWLSFPSRLCSTTSDPFKNTLFAYATLRTADSDRPTSRLSRAGGRHARLFQRRLRPRARF